MTRWNCPTKEVRSRPVDPRPSIVKSGRTANLQDSPGHTLGTSFAQSVAIRAYADASDVHLQAKN